MERKKIALITGAASGIGLAIAKRFILNGDTVYVTDINEENLQKVKKVLQEYGRHVYTRTLDVTNEEMIHGCIKEIDENHGSIDVVVNNAGMQHVAPLENFPTEAYRQMLELMLIGPFMLTKAVFPMMKNQSYGRIMNMASINGLIGFAGKAGYNSAKHGLIGLTKVAALEGASFGITVNAICPGYVDTPLVRNQLKDLAKTRNVSQEKVLEEVIYPLVPQKRLIEPEEVASYALFLASEQAKGITGQALVIDGGYVAQ